MSYPKDPFYQKQEASSYYPTQMGAPGSNPYPPAAYPSAPPPYSAVPPSTMPGGAAPPQYPPGQYAYGGAGMPQPYPPGLPNYSYGPTGPPGPPMAQPPYNPGYPVQPNFNYAMPPGPAVAQFDSGARFDGIATHNIPPPPPGYAPNAAQMATAQGQTVIAGQKKASWFSGGSGGGVSFW